MIKYEDIEKANQSLRTTDIKGKDYTEVHQRIKAFRMCYPEGTIETEIIGMQNGVVTMKSIVKNQEGKVLGTGLAQEKESSTYINKTSFIENCETSSVGRALGMCGFGIDTSIASSEEVTNAINNQDKPKATPKQVQMLANHYIGDNLKKLLDANKIEKLEDMPKEKATELIGKLMEKGKQQNV